jgi:NDP-sugar pyrophosphorylase family protein
MKALILAAGKGSRLKNVTNNTPKPMVLFQNKPLLQHNIELCKTYGIKEIFINTSHLANKITDYFGNGIKFGVSITYSYEQELLGTSGALLNFKNYLSQEPFFVLYGDNVSQFNLQSLKEKGEKENTIATIGFHHREDIENCGVAEFNKNNKITKFIEKPNRSDTESRLVNSGAYFLKPEIFKYITYGFSDFGKDIFPLLLKKNIPMYGVCSNKKVLAFDTEELLQKSQKDSL